MRGVLLVLSVALVAGCSDDEAGLQEPTTESTPERSASTTGPSPTSSTISGEADCQHRPPSSSPAVFDAAVGTYAAQGVSLSGDSKSLTFDVVQWLSGEEARQAWAEENPDDPGGPPNDYLIVNVSDRVRTASVDREATVFLTHLEVDGTASVEPDSLEGLREDTSGTYWLTFESGVITEICEQYRP